MSNSIDLSLGADNKMKALLFHWVAIFKDGSFLPQFDPQTNQENLFRLVQDRFDDLEYFVLKHQSKDIQFKVDLTTCTIYDGPEYIISDKIIGKSNIRLIYFRRVTREIGEQDLLVKSINITYFLGFQYLVNGRNEKVVIQIDSNGNWALGE